METQPIYALLHKIRNSLTSIKTCLSVLKAAPDIHRNEPALGIVDMTLGETNRLVGLLTDLKNAYYFEKGPAEREIEKG